MTRPKWLRLPWRKKPNAPNTRHIYTGTDGRRYYTYTNPMHTAQTRAVAAESALRMAEWGLSKQRLIDLMAEARKCLEEGRGIDLGAIIVEIEMGLTSIAEEDALLNVAAALILEEGEPDAYDSARAAAKIARWKNSPADKGFFLQQAWTCTRQYGAHSDLDILTYLRLSGPLMKGSAREARRSMGLLTKKTSPPAASQGAASSKSTTSNPSPSGSTTRSYGLPSR